jgi:hypothetical protein
MSVPSDFAPGRRLSPTIVGAADISHLWSHSVLLSGVPNTNSAVGRYRDDALLNRIEAAARWH